MVDSFNGFGFVRCDFEMDGHFFLEYRVEGVREREMEFLIELNNCIPNLRPPSRVSLSQRLHGPSTT